MKVYITFCWMEPGNVSSVWSTRGLAEAAASLNPEIMEVQEFIVDEHRSKLNPPATQWIINMRRDGKVVSAMQGDWTDLETRYTALSTHFIAGERQPPEDDRCQWIGRADSKEEAISKCTERMHKDPNY